MKCDVMVVSPVHIGSGYTYGPSEYLHFSIKGNDAFKRVNIIDYYQSLDDDIQRKQLLDSLSMEDFSLKDFDDKISKNYTKYITRDICEEIPERNEIKECIKTFNKAYIPGSSIKGAIKTAILYNNVNDWQMRDVNRFVRNRFDNKFINRFLTYEAQCNDAQRNILKFLQISDSTYVKQFAICDIHVKLASERRGFKSNYTKNNSKSYLEVINRGSKVSFNIKNSFNEDFHKILNADDKKRLINMENIKEWIYEFSYDLIENELEFSEVYGLEKLNKFYRKNKHYNKEEKPLLRIGSGSGFLSTTLGLKIKEYNYNAFRQIVENKKAYEFCFPKSRKLTCLEDYPLGWIQLDFKDE